MVTDFQLRRRQLAAHDERIPDSGTVAFAVLDCRSTSWAVADAPGGNRRGAGRQRP
jgi:hypothetical protein